MILNNNHAQCAQRTNN